MSYESKDQIFLYHGYSLGAGGYVERNGQYLPIDGIAPGALSFAGGKYSSREGCWSWAPPCEPDPPRGFRISIGETSTELWTEETEKEWITHGQVTIKEFNLCERLKIGLIVSKLTSRHRKHTKREQARISFSGSQLWNVSVDGVEVDVPIDHTLDSFQTHRELREVIAGKKRPSPSASFTAEQCTDWSSSFCQRNLIDAREGSPDYVVDMARKYKSDHLTRCSIAGQPRMAKELPGVQPHGYSIDIADFGRIFFGEMIVADGMKRLNMVRWNLGCTNCGDGSGGTVDLNGVTMP